MADDLFHKLFRTRQRRIKAADSAAAEALRLFGEAKTRDRRRLTLAAAKQCEKAASLYREAGLGLLAKKQFADASRAFSLGGDCEGARLNQERWSAVSTHWEETDGS